MLNEVSLRLPTLRPDQWAIASHPAKVKTIVAGRRYGKTTLGGSISMIMAAHGGRVCWNVPVYKNGRPLWRWADITVAPLRRVGLVSTNKSDRLIEFKSSGGFLGIYSMDSPDSIRGDYFHLAVNDESARISEEAYTDAIQPTIADVNGDILNITTPRGKNWVYREYLRGTRLMSHLAASFHAPSNLNPNKNIQRAMVRAKDLVGERTFRQEWMAEFLDNEGTVFHNIGACLGAPKDDVPANHVGHNIVAGIDWGKSVDPTVVCIFCATCRKELRLVRMLQIDYRTQRSRVYSLCEFWGVMYIEAEANAMGAPIIDELSHGDEYPLKDILVVHDREKPQYVWVHHELGGKDGPFNNHYDPTDANCLQYNPKHCRWGRSVPVENPLFPPMELWLGGEYSIGLNIHPFVTTNASKGMLIESLALAFERTEAQWLDDRIGKLELEAFEMEMNPVTGRTVYSAPDGEHDDTVIARGLAWRAATLPAGRIIDFYKNLAGPEASVPSLPGGKSIIDTYITGIEAGRTYIEIMKEAYAS